MTCQAHTSYAADETLWGYRFEPCMPPEKGAFQVDYSRFKMTFEVQTPAASAKELHELKELEAQPLLGPPPADLRPAGARQGCSHRAEHPRQHGRRRPGRAAGAGGCHLSRGTRRPAVPSAHGGAWRRVPRRQCRSPPSFRGAEPSCPRPQPRGVTFAKLFFCNKEREIQTTGD